MTQGDEHRTAALAPLGAGLALIGALALGAHSGLLPAPWARAAAPLLFGGALIGPLARLTPGPASPIKLLLFASLLTPVAWTGLDVLLRIAMGNAEGAGRAATGVLLVAAIAGQLACRGRRLRVERLGLGAWGAIVLAALVAGWTAAVLLEGSAARVSFHGLLHSGLALACERAVPPTNPWLAGEPLGYYWAWHALGGVVTRVLGGAPTVAFAWIGVWAAACSVLALQQVAAVLFRGARRELAGTAFALFGLSALGGWYALLRGQLGAAAPADNAELLASLRALLVPVVGGELAWDPRVAFGLSKFGNLSSYPSALALGLGGMAAAAHALRHGHRTWILLCAATIGASFALNPLVGGPIAGITACSAFVVGATPRVRFGLPATLVVAALPGLWLVREAQQAYAGAPIGLSFSAARSIAVLGPWALLLPPAVWGLLCLRRELEPGDPRWRVAWMLALAVVADGVAAACVELPWANEYKFVRLGALPAGLLAGAGLFGADGSGRRLVGVLCALPLTVGAALDTWVGARAYLGLSGVQLPLVESPGRLAPEPGAFEPARDARAAYDWLATDSRVRGSGAVLALDPRRTGGVAFGAGPDGHGFRFTTAQNLQAHEAVAFADLDLFCDRPSQVLSEQDPVAQLRRDALEELFAGKEPWSEATRRTLFDHPRPLLVWIESRADGARPGFERGLERFGFELVFEAGGVRIWLAPGVGVDRWRAREGAAEGTR